MTANFIKVPKVCKSYNVEKLMIIKASTVAEQELEKDLINFWEAFKFFANKYGLQKADNEVINFSIYYSKNVK